VAHVRSLQLRELTQSLGPIARISFENGAVDALWTIGFASGSQYAHTHPSGGMRDASH